MTQRPNLTGEFLQGRNSPVFVVMKPPYVVQLPSADRINFGQRMFTIFGNFSIFGNSCPVGVARSVSPDVG